MVGPSPRNSFQNTEFGQRAEATLSKLDNTQFRRLLDQFGLNKSNTPVFASTRSLHTRKLLQHCHDGGIEINDALIEPYMQVNSPVKTSRRKSMFNESPVIKIDSDPDDLASSEPVQNSRNMRKRSQSFAPTEQLPLEKFKSPNKITNSPLRAANTRKSSLSIQNTENYDNNSQRNLNKDFNQISTPEMDKFANRNFKSSTPTESFNKKLEPQVSVHNKPVSYSSVAAKMGTNAIRKSSRPNLNASSLSNNNQSLNFSTYQRSNSCCAFKKILLIGTVVAAIGFCVTGAYHYFADGEADVGNMFPDLNE